MTRYLLLFDSYGLVFVGRPLLREDGSVFFICCWPLPAQSFPGPGPLGLVTIFYCLRFATTLFVASYHSQGHDGRIRHRCPTDYLSLSLMLWPTVSRPVCLGIKHPSVAYDPIFITVGQLRVCWCGALSLTRGRVWRLQLLLALASAVILGSESLGTRDRILLSQIWDFLFVASYDSQGHGGGIRPRLHTGNWLFESESCVTTDGQSASLSLYIAPIRGLRPDFHFRTEYGIRLTLTFLIPWGALSDERTGLSFVCVAGLASAVFLGS
jgi:hypothetical protein